MSSQRPEGRDGHAASKVAGQLFTGVRMLQHQGNHADCSQNSIYDFLACSVISRKADTKKVKHGTCAAPFWVALAPGSSHQFPMRPADITQHPAAVQMHSYTGTPLRSNHDGSARWLCAIRSRALPCWHIMAISVTSPFCSSSQWCHTYSGRTVRSCCRGHCSPGVETPPLTWRICLKGQIGVASSQSDTWSRTQNCWSCICTRPLLAGMWRMAPRYWA